MTPGFTRYAPASGARDWLLVAGRRFVAAFESTVSDEILDTVWWLAESELATIESVVGAFPLTGTDAVRSFAVAELGEPNAAGEVVVTAVVRGTAVVDVFSVGGSRRFSAGGVQPWVLAEFRSVTGLVIGGDDLATGPVAQATVGSLPLGTGIVDGEVLVWSSAALKRLPRDAPDASQNESHGSPAENTDETIIRPRGGASLFAHPGAEPETDPESDPVPQGGQPAAHELPGAVDIEPPADTPKPTGGAADSDGFPPTQPVAIVPAARRFAIRLGSGDAFALDVPVLIGRRPAPLRVASGPQPRLIAVSSPDQQVSSTHLQIEQVGDAVVVTDLRSTNGTVVSPLGGRSSRLRPGQSMAVLPGAIVEIGDGNIIEITAAPEES
ncbi:FHA domain-containing protein [Leifsonia sp. NPDC058230]|uniref:FHA domain-containing protein n=1 Tax=Leifsonia sp. NPDC058230 TaxID=3346391 RepID=UPI0036D8402F